MMKKFTTMETPIGRLAIAEKNGALTHITLFDRDTAKEFTAANISEGSSPLLKDAVKQLDEYFSKKRKSFALPLGAEGTPFQQRVWTALTKIPYGTTATYKDIAVRVDCPKGFRAVGMANNRNPIMIVVPCHRVIGSNGSLVGYEGGVHIKEALLKLEGVL